jgi:hypothetical protein
MPSGRPISTSPISFLRSISYDRQWPIWTYAEITPPAKFIHDENGRRGMATSSLVSGGCIISGTRIDKSLLFTGVCTHSYGELTHVVALPYATIGRHARLSRVVIDPRGHHSGATGRRGGSGRGCAALPSNTFGDLSHHPTDDRSAAGLIVRVLMVAAECVPLMKTGGLADAVGGLSRALGSLGCEVRVLLPCYLPSRSICRTRM